MKRKIIGIILCILMLIITTLPVTGNIAKINQQKLYKSRVLDDMNIDLAITNAFSNNVRILLGDGYGGFTNSGSISIENFPLGITKGDFNGDGILDLITTSFENHNVTVLLGDGTGGFSNSGSFLTGMNPVGITDEDFNNDGNQDIAIANRGADYISVLLGNGTGDFKTQSPYNVRDGPVGLTHGTFNADDNCDLIVSNIDDNSVSLLLGDGAGGFVLSKSIVLGLNYKPVAITKGDFNLDGDLDVAVASGGNPYVGILHGDGEGGFGSLKNYNVGNGSERFDIITADFNNDECLDIAVSNTDDNTVSVLLGNVSTGFETHKTYPVGNYPVGICKGDFNADGNTDLAVANTNDDAIGILLGDGAGGFGTQQTYPAGDGPVRIISGNINYIPVPDLECQDSINWTNINPGTILYSEFTIKNIGDPGSKLYWEVSEHPTEWGSNWTFSPNNGTGLTPEAGLETIFISVEIPDESKKEFHGTIKVVNENNPSDYCEIELYLQTPRSNTVFYSVFFRLFEHFLNAFPVFRNLIRL